MTKFLIKLFISGHTWKSQRALENLRRLCREELPEDTELLVIDVLEQPDLAEADQIMATPTLVRELPLPVRCIVGDLSDLQKVRIGLGLEPRTSPIDAMEARNE